MIHYVVISRFSSTKYRSRDLIKRRPTTSTNSAASSEYHKFRDHNFRRERRDALPAETAPAEQPAAVREKRLQLTFSVQTDSVSSKDFIHSAATVQQLEFYRRTTHEERSVLEWPGFSIDKKSGHSAFRFVRYRPHGRRVG